MISRLIAPNAEHVQSQPRERNQKGETPLHTASIKNEMDNVRKLLEAGENPNVTDFAGKLMRIVFGVEENDLHERPTLFLPID